MVHRNETAEERARREERQRWHEEWQVRQVRQMREERETKEAAGQEKAASTSWPSRKRSERPASS